MGGCFRINLVSVKINAFTVAFVLKINTSKPPILSIYININPNDYDLKTKYKKKSIFSRVNKVKIT